MLQVARMLLGVMVWSLVFCTVFIAKEEGTLVVAVLLYVLRMLKLVFCGKQADAKFQWLSGVFRVI
jgi:hypothetical protein